MPVLGKEICPDLTFSQRAERASFLCSELKLSKSYSSFSIKAWCLKTIEFISSILVSEWQPQSRRLWGWWNKAIPKLRLRLPPFSDDPQSCLLLHTGSFFTFCFSHIALARAKYPGAGILLVRMNCGRFGGPRQGFLSVPLLLPASGYYRWL